MQNDIFIALKTVFEVTADLCIPATDGDDRNIRFNDNTQSSILQDLVDDRVVLRET